MHTLSPFALAFRDRAEDSLTVPIARSLARCPLRGSFCVTERVPRSLLRPIFVALRARLPVTSANAHRLPGGHAEEKERIICCGPSENAREAHLYLRLYTCILLALLALAVTLRFIAKQFLCARIDIVLHQMDKLCCGASYLFFFFLHKFFEDSKGTLSSPF